MDNTTNKMIIYTYGCFFANPNHTEGVKLQEISCCHPSNKNIISDKQETVIARYGRT